MKKKKNYNSPKTIGGVTSRMRRSLPLIMWLLRPLFSRTRSRISVLQTSCFTRRELVAGAPATSGCDAALLFNLGDSGKNGASETGRPVESKLPSYCSFHSQTLRFSRLFHARGLGSPRANALLRLPESSGCARDNWGPLPILVIIRPRACDRPFHVTLRERTALDAPWVLGWRMSWVSGLDRQAESCKP